jgi:hypothetical protein
MLLFSNFVFSMMRGTAYLDPGSGSFLLQLLLAAGLGALFAIKVYWKKLVGIFKKPADKKEPDPAEGAEPTDER